MLRPRARLLCAVSAGAVVLALSFPSGQVIGAGRRVPGRFDRSGIDGSGQAVMQSVNTGLRMALVASVPGSNNAEAWGIATSHAKVPGWAGEKGGGQTLFLKFTRNSGWRIMGPPEDGGGNVKNLRLTALSFAENGEGWAVGDNGTLVRRDGDRWVVSDKAEAKPGGSVKSVLTSVSIRSDGGSTFGFALGQGSTILRLSNGRWQEEEFPTAPGEDTYDLAAISTVGRDEAWVAGGLNGAVLVFRRTGEGWRRVMIGDEEGESFFDQPRVRRADGMATPVASTTAGSLAATSRGAWVGGTITPLADPKSALGDPSGDVTRPFAIFFPSNGGDAETYCPDEYSLNSDQKSVTNSICERPFPRAGFGLSAMHAFENGEVFAGGLGVFHFNDGAWFREPDPVGFVATLSFTHPAEGWVAGTGNTYGARSSVSSIGTLGHWTESPSSPRKARWPQPPSDPTTLLSYPLEGIALAPDRSGRAIAVGQQGARYLYTPEIGWESTELLTRLPLHGVAWPAVNHAWAVGGQGTIMFFDGTRWAIHSQSGKVVTASIFDVAFSSPTRGYAVGANGVILKYDGSRWAKDPASAATTSDDLYAIDTAGSDFIAVGANGVVLVNSSGAWRRDESVSGLIERGGQRPALFTVDGLPDGTAVAGGELGTLIRRESGRWTVDREGKRVPPEGSIVALGARKTSGRLDLFASVSYERTKYSGENPGLVTGFMLYGDDKGWRDLDHSTRITTYPTLEASAPVDPVLAIAVEGDSAWAVGGTGAGNDDGQGHVAAYPTGSIYRVDLSGDPRPKGQTVLPSLDTDRDVITFAFFGESTCGRGFCSSTMGSGTKADAVTSQIQREINEMSKHPGGPKFVVFGGSMRKIGIPEELGEFKRSVQGFRIPFYAALGSSDLFTDLASVALDQVPDYDGNVTRVREQFPDPSDASFYLQGFNDMAQPWGKGPRPKGIEPILIGDGARQDQARTHYAFDYVEGSKRLRIIVLDTAGTRMTNSISTQNPSQDQLTWLEQVLRNGKDLGAQSIVIMNRPYQNPLETGLDAQPHPDTNVQTAISIAGLYSSAVISSYFRANAVDLLKLEGVASTMPVYIFGGGGAPLEATIRKPPDPALGYYHSYQLISVNFSRKIPPLNLNRSEVYARSFPVLDNVAMTALDGNSVKGGNTLRFTGSGRVVEGGGPGDPFQSRAAVVPLDLVSAGVCPPDPADSNRPKCKQLSGGPIGPTFLYTSENPEIGTFVRPAVIDPRIPYIDPATGAVVPDSTSGLFCSFKAGQTYVSLSSGFHRARKQVTVTGGSGPCVKDPVPGLFSDIVRRPGSVQVPLTRAESRPYLFSPPGFDIPPVGIVIPPFVPILAPAPPAAGGYAKREQHKQATEEQGQEFRAIQVGTRVPLAVAGSGRPLGSSPYSKNRLSFTAVRESSRYSVMDDPVMLTVSALSIGLSVGLTLGLIKRRRVQGEFNPVRLEGQS